jgi:hypothetical protein
MSLDPAKTHRIGLLTASRRSRYPRPLSDPVAATKKDPIPRGNPGSSAIPPEAAVVASQPSFTEWVKNRCSTSPCGRSAV